MECIFCKIADGSSPAKKIYDDANVSAFLDINPANPGHCLVISKKHFENIYDITDEELKEMIVVVKAIAGRIKDKMKPDGVNILQNNGKHAGQLVNHIHFHIIPRFPDDKVVITYQRVQLTEKDFEDVKNKLETEKEKVEKKEEPRAETLKDRIRKEWGKDF